MRKVIDFIEGPILLAASCAMAFTYRNFGVSPRRQVPGWEIAISLIESICIFAMSAVLWRSGERQLCYILPITAISAAIDAGTSYRKLSRMPGDYDAKAYRAALTEAEMHRHGAVFLRGFSLVIPLLAFVNLLAPWPGILQLAAGAVFIYFSLYVSKFYVRAAEPPHPDEGDRYYAAAFG